MNVQFNVSGVVIGLLFIAFAAVAFFCYTQFARVESEDLEILENEKKP